MTKDKQRMKLIRSIKKQGLITLGRYYTHKKQYQVADMFYGKALDTDANHLSASHYHSYAYVLYEAKQFQIGAYKDIRNRGEKQMTKDKQRMKLIRSIKKQGLITLGRYYTHKKQYQVADMFYGKALDTDANHLSASHYHSYAYVLYEAKQF